MAHLKLKKPRSRRVKPPKPVPPPKILRPKRTLLRSHYKELFTTDIDQRVDALSKAMAWYDQCLGYLAFKQEGKLTTGQLRLKIKAEESRTSGIQSNHSHNKESKFTAAIKHYEKACAVYKPPKIVKYLSLLTRKLKGMELRKEKLKNKFGTFLVLLQKALDPKNAEGKKISLRVDKINAQHRIDSEGNVTFDRKLVLHLRRLMRRYGFLSPVLQCIPILTEAAGRTPELDTRGHKTGRTIISARKRYNSFLEMMYHLNRFMMTDESPRRLVRKPRTKRPKEV